MSILYVKYIPGTGKIVGKGGPVPTLEGLSNVYAYVEHDASDMDVKVLRRDYEVVNGEVVLKGKPERDLAKAEEEASLFRLAIHKERKRRIVSGAPITVTGYLQTIHTQGRDQDRDNLMALAQLAQVRLSELGKRANRITTVFRDKNNVDHILTPEQVTELFLKSAEYVELVMQASWALKALEPFSVDITDDANWP